MSKVEDKAKELNNWLLNQELIKEYKKYETLIKKHPEISKQQKTLKAMQKKIVIEKSKDHDCSSLIHEYELMKEQYYNNPIVNNYIVLKEEVNNLIQQINNIINQGIK